MSSFLIRLYPACWRARYRDEFEALLEQRPLGPFDVADILLGAMDAQLRLRGHGAMSHGRGLSMSLRIGGFAAIIGAGLLAAAGFLSYDLVSVAGAVQPFLLFTGLAALLVALAGLSAFQARAHPRLTWGAFAMTAVGTIVAAIGLVAMTLFAGDSYWALWLGGLLTALVGSALFAISTYRTATLSRAGAVLLGTGSILPFVGMNQQPMYLASVICFLLGWLVLGVQAIRLDRPATTPRPA
jgi:hypothetical protein